MATVDPDDDSLRRYVVRSYAYDPSRRERRHVVVAAFDKRREFLHLIQRLNQDLERRRAAGEPVDPREHVTGITLEPGHRRRQQDARLLRAAIRHRVELSEEFMHRLDLPVGVYVRAWRQ